MAKTDLRRIRTLQQNNRRDIEELENQASKLEKELETKLKLLDEKFATKDLSLSDGLLRPQGRDPAV